MTRTPGGAVTLDAHEFQALQSLVEDRLDEIRLNTESRRDIAEQKKRTPGLKDEGQRELDAIENETTRNR